MSEECSIITGARRARNAEMAWRWVRRWAGMAMVAAAVSSAQAINITVDFSLDTTGFFAGNAAARNIEGAGEQQQRQQDEVQPGRVGHDMLS